MARLRVRMELNRGGVGVPLHKLASVVDEAQKFFRMLGDDVHIERDRGEWMGLDFDNKSLNFTAEFVGPVEPGQVREFYAAFDGVTQLRRATIAQFARIADAIEEDELIGFGLYQSDQETEPSEWRSLSKREALRITEEIRLLLDRAESGDMESRIPAALDTSAGASLFRERREHGGLSERVARLENEMSRHSEAIQTLRGTTAATEQNLQNLLTAVDAFCDRATRQMERLPAPAAPASEPGPFPWRIPAAIAVLCALGGLALFYGSIEPRTPNTPVQAADPARQKPAPAPPAPPPPAPAAPLKIEVKAIEATWVGIYADGKLTFAKVLGPDQSKTVESSGKVRVQVGNAGGVEITANGKPVGDIGPRGEVRTIDFTQSGFHIIQPATKLKPKPTPDSPGPVQPDNSGQQITPAEPRP
jgi:hypothetical protein